MAFIEKGEAHLGGSFSMIESLLTIYEMILKKNDKFILSKAHASFPLCILLKEKGLNPEIKTHLDDFVIPSRVYISKMYLNHLSRTQNSGGG